MNDTNRKGYTALMAAAASGNVECVNRLLAAGADPAARGRDGMTSLRLAQQRDATYEERQRVMKALVTAATGDFPD